MSKIYVTILFFATTRGLTPGCLPSHEFILPYEPNVPQYYGGYYLETKFLQGKKLGSGAYGLVHQINCGGVLLAVKRQNNPTTLTIDELLTKEIRNLITMRGKGAVVEFHGCMQTGTYTYLVFETLHGDMDNEDLLKDFRAKPAIDRIRAYKLIIEKFGKLHDEKIIHIDLKPANIMAANPEVTDFRIVDLGFSSIENENGIGGTPHYNSPERIFAPEKMPLFMPATRVHDIYALGLTIASIEADYRTVYLNVPDDCFLVTMTPSCHSMLMWTMGLALKDGTLELLVPILKRASSYSAANRYQSMAQFADGVQSIMNLMASPVTKGLSVGIMKKMGGFNSLTVKPQDVGEVKTIPFNPLLHKPKLYELPEEYFNPQPLPVDQQKGQPIFKQVAVRRTVLAGDMSNVSAPPPDFNIGVPGGQGTVVNRQVVGGPPRQIIVGQPRQVIGGQPQTNIMKTLPQSVTIPTQQLVERQVLQSHGVRIGNTLVRQEAPTQNFAPTVQFTYNTPPVVQNNLVPVQNNVVFVQNIQPQPQFTPTITRGVVLNGMVHQNLGWYLDQYNSVHYIQLTLI